jgi:hypothetical protein
LPNQSNNSSQRNRFKFPSKTNSDNTSANEVAKTDLSNNYSHIHETQSDGILTALGSPDMNYSSDLGGGSEDETSPYTQGYARRKVSFGLPLKKSAESNSRIGSRRSYSHDAEGLS